jgi:2,3-dihydroxybenzoate decarboxylase
MKIIDLEAHFYTHEYIEYLCNREEFPREERGDDGIKLWYTEDFWAPRSYDLEERLLDLGEARIKEMDADGIDMQVISLTNPNVQLFEEKEGVLWAKRVNDELSTVVGKYPDRYIGLASVAPQNPQEAAKEIERSVKELGLKGIVVQSHAQNEYLDDKKYWPLFEKAEALDVPIYLHPIAPSTSILEPYAKYGFPLAGPILGFAADVSLHVMRLIYGGLFDQYPKLKIILGHLGEGLPYWFPRLDFYWHKKWVGKGPGIKRKPSDYLKTNFVVTTSGIFFQPAFLCAYLAMGADKIAFAVDYPYEENTEALAFMKEAPICDEDKEKIYHSNAEKLFNL